MYYTVMDEGFMLELPGLRNDCGAAWEVKCGVPVQTDAQGNMLRIYSTDPNVFLALHTAFRRL